MMTSIDRDRASLEARARTKALRRLVKKLVTNVEEAQFALSLIEEIVIKHQAHIRYAN